MLMTLGKSLGQVLMILKFPQLQRGTSEAAAKSRAIFSSTWTSKQFLNRGFCKVMNV